MLQVICDEVTCVSDRINKTLNASLKLYVADLRSFRILFRFARFEIAHTSSLGCLRSLLHVNGSVQLSFSG